MDINKLKDNLVSKGYEVSIFKNGSDAAKYLDGKIDGKTVGFGGSMTIKEIGLYDLLKIHNKMFSHWEAKNPTDISVILKDALKAEIYLSSVNAMSMDGEIVNIDGTCNRIAGMTYGHEKVYLVVSTNKICENLEDAIKRANEVAAVKNAKRFNKTAKDISNATLIFHKRPGGQPIEVVLIEEEHGF